MPGKLGKIAASLAQGSLIASLLVGLAGCSSVNSLFGGSSRIQPLGGVVADEPRAAIAGRDVLNQGGSAADAAVATYFALSVTMPSAAGLGGGGVCLSWNAASASAEVIDFLPRPTAGGTMTVPSNVRGMALLQARGGRLRWEQDVAPAEALARLAPPLSRAAAQALGAVDPTKIGPDAYQLFTSGSGHMPAEGASLQQIELAAVLARIRAAGAGDFYVGQVAHDLVANIGRAYGDLTLDDLRDARPDVATALTVDYGGTRLYMPPAPAAGGSATADILKALANAKYADAAPAQRPQILADATGRALNAAAPQATPPAAGLVTNDFEGNSVACTFTMLSPLGTGQMIANSGIVTAPAPPPGGVLSMAPLLGATSGSGGRAFLSLAATGAAAPATAAATVAAIRAGQPAEAAIAQSDTARENLIACPGGAVDRCSYIADPRSAGLALRRSAILQ